MMNLDPAARMRDPQANAYADLEKRLQERLDARTRDSATLAAAIAKSTEGLGDSVIRLVDARANQERIAAVVRLAQLVVQIAILAAALGLYFRH
jgi:hypothetical protein